MKQGLVRLLYNFGKRFMGWTLHMIMCVLLCYPISIRIYYQQGVLFLVIALLLKFFYLLQIIASKKYVSSVFYVKSRELLTKFIHRLYFRDVLYYDINVLQDTIDNP